MLLTVICCCHSNLDRCLLLTPFLCFVRNPCNDRIAMWHRVKMASPYLILPNLSKVLDPIIKGSLFCRVFAAKSTRITAIPDHHRYYFGTWYAVMLATHTYLCEANEAMHDICSTADPLHAWPPHFLNASYAPVYRTQFIRNRCGQISKGLLYTSRPCVRCYKIKSMYWADVCMSV